MRVAAWVKVATASFVALLGGEWLGEGLTEPLALFAGLALLVIACAVAAWLSSPPPWLRRAGLAVGVAVLAVGGFLLGDRIAYSAFNACVVHGKQVRVALAEYRARTGRYPTRLQDLGVPLPGGRLLRGGILSYEARGEGYRLSFGDWLITHQATDSDEWTAQK